MVANEERSLTVRADVVKFSVGKAASAAGALEMLDIRDGHFPCPKNRKPFRLSNEANIILLVIREILSGRRFRRLTRVPFQLVEAAVPFA